MKALHQKSVAIQPISLKVLFLAAIFLTAGHDHTCAVLKYNIYCWGLNDEGQLGIGRSGDSLIPTTVDVLSAGDSHEIDCLKLKLEDLF
jgi:alpha-tubulin suppressor-like RCC1 family protein